MSDQRRGVARANRLPRHGGRRLRHGLRRHARGDDGRRRRPRGPSTAPRRSLERRLPLRAASPALVVVRRRLDLALLDGPTSGFTVLGGGKTAMDTCTWVLERGVAPEGIRWVRPRDAWTLDRAFLQPSVDLPRLVAGLAAHSRRPAAQAARRTSSYGSRPPVNSSASRGTSSRRRSAAPCSPSASWTDSERSRTSFGSAALSTSGPIASASRTGRSRPTHAGSTWTARRRVSR